MEPHAETPPSPPLARSMIDRRTARRIATIVWLAIAVLPILLLGTCAAVVLAGSGADAY